jgi:hypothetical protein
VAYAAATLEGSDQRTIVTNKSKRNYTPTGAIPGRHVACLKQIY